MLEEAYATTQVLPATLPRFPKVTPVSQTPLPPVKASPVPQIPLLSVDMRSEPHVPLASQTAWSIPLPVSTQSRATPKGVQPTLVMCICASSDQSYLRQWEAHLRPLEQAGYLNMWSDHHILAGLPRQQQMMRTWI